MYRLPISCIRPLNFSFIDLHLRLQSFITSIKKPDSPIKVHFVKIWSTRTELQVKKKSPTMGIFTYLFSYNTRRIDLISTTNSKRSPQSPENLLKLP